MNLILVHPEELCDNQHPNQAIVTLSDRRFQHIATIHKPQKGDTLRVGILNGKLGSATVKMLSNKSITLELNLEENPPPALAATLLLALPRPKMLKRIIQSITTLGIKDIYLINSYRVEKSYWQSPLLHPEALQEQLILGLEQARDTLLPTIHLKKRFKPFVDDDLPALIGGAQCVIAHPSLSAKPCISSTQKKIVAVGPEGGFIDYEVNKFNQLNFETVTLGSRILKVETAIPSLLSRLFPL